MGVNDKQLISALCCNIFLPHLFATSFAVAMMSPKRLNSSHLRRKLKPTRQIYNSGSQSACLPVYICVYLCVWVCVQSIFDHARLCKCARAFRRQLCAAYCQLLSINCAFMSTSVESGCCGEGRGGCSLVCWAAVFTFSVHTHRKCSRILCLMWSIKSLVRLTSSRSLWAIVALTSAADCLQTKAVQIFDYKVGHRHKLGQVELPTDTLYGNDVAK